MGYRASRAAFLLPVAWLATGVAAARAESPVPAAALLSDLIALAALPPASARALGRRFGVDRAVCTAAPTELRDARESCESRVLLRGPRGEAVPGRLRAWWSDSALLGWELAVEGPGQSGLRAAIEARFGPACGARSSMIHGPAGSGPVLEHTWHLDGPFVALALEEGPGNATALAGISAAAGAGHVLPPATARCRSERR